MSEAAAKAASPRPQYRNIHVSQIVQYRLPPAGIVSILHRISGALLFLVGFPFLLYLFDQSLTSELSFERYRAVVSHWFAKLVLLALIWAYLHHFLAGLRYLALDMQWGIQKAPSRSTALAVLIVSLVLTAVLGLKLFGAY